MTEPPMADVDQLLAAEDPQFAAAMTELREQVAQDAVEAAAVTIEGLDLEEKPRPVKMADRARQFFANSGSALKSGLKIAAVKSRDGAKLVGRWLKEVLTLFKSLPVGSKLLVVLVILIGAFSVFAVRMVLRGHYLPTLENQFLRSFAEVADAKYTYEEDEPMEDFTDPIFHPEHVMLIDKIVVNLRSVSGRVSGSANPMGLFEFYIEVSSDEAAIEVKDREVEIRDLIGRTIEQVSYGDLATASGKNKLKLILRKNLNEFLTRGRVRRVLYRNIVLKD